MGRNRKKANDHLPPRVYNNNGTIVYRDYKDGKLQKPVRLGNKNTPISEIWSAWEAITGRADNTLQFLVDQYRKGDDFRNLKSKVHRDKCLNRMLGVPVGKGRIFGQVLLKDVTPGLIRQYLDWRANIAGSREISYLSKAWAWCYERDIVTLPNPCAGVRKKRNPPRDRYVTDAEFQLVYDAAPKYIKVAMSLAFLCRMRLGEVLDTRVKDMSDEGLLVRRSKGSNDAITVWSDELRRVVDYGLQGHVRVPEMPVVNNGKGGAIRASAFSTAWQRLMGRLVSEGIVERFTFHDLKAKGVSDFSGDKQKAGGHKSPRMVSVYDRKLIMIEPTK